MISIRKFIEYNFPITGYKECNLFCGRNYDGYFMMGAIYPCSMDYMIDNYYISYMKLNFVETDSVIMGIKPDKAYHLQCKTKRIDDNKSDNWTVQQELLCKFNIEEDLIIFEDKL